MTTICRFTAINIKQENSEKYTYVLMCVCVCAYAFVCFQCTEYAFVSTEADAVVLREWAHTIIRRLTFYSSGRAQTH